MDKPKEAERLQEEYGGISPTKDKRPLIKYTETRGLTRQQIQRFFSEPACDIAIVTGEVTTVFDADTPEGIEWCSKNLETGRIVKTKNRGFHFHMQPIDFPSKQNLFGLGIDVRNNGSLATVPFSEGYCWVSQGEMGKVDLSILPAIEVPNIQPINVAGCEAMVERTRLYLNKVPGAESGKQGHSAAFRVACIIGDRLAAHMKPEDALWIMQEWNQKCTPPFSDQELIHKLQDSWGRS